MASPMLSSPYRGEGEMRGRKAEDIFPAFLGEGRSFRSLVRMIAMDDKGVRLG